MASFCCKLARSTHACPSPLRTKRCLARWTDAWGDADYEEWGPDVGRSRAAGSSAMQMQQQEDEFDIEGNGPWGSAWRLRAAVVAAAGDMIRLDPLRADDSEALEALVVERALPVRHSMLGLLAFISSRFVVGFVLGPHCACTTMGRWSAQRGALMPVRHLRSEAHDCYKEELTWKRKGGKIQTEAWLSSIMCLVGCGSHHVAGSEEAGHVQATNNTGMIGHKCPVLPMKGTDGSFS
eukprot:1153133-Pelagomonas_calceolata.AAC.1